jgi:hypothetical protein
MRSHEIQKLIDAVEVEYGTVTLYGSTVREEHGTCFKIKDVHATFSVNTNDGELPSDHYDIQIESQPAGDYIYTATVSLDGFLVLVKMMLDSMDKWPTAIQ